MNNIAGFIKWSGESGFPPLLEGEAYWSFTPKHAVARLHTTSSTFGLINDNQYMAVSAYGRSRRIVFLAVPWHMREEQAKDLYTMLSSMLPREEKPTRQNMKPILDYYATMIRLELTL